MGACVSSTGLTEEDRAKHREAERQLKEANAREATFANKMKDVREKQEKLQSKIPELEEQIKEAKLQHKMLERMYRNIAAEAERLLTKAMSLVAYEQMPALKVQMTWCELRVWRGEWSAAEVALQSQLDSIPEADDTGSYWIAAARRMLDEVRQGRKDEAAKEMATSSG